jgi:hypothetical protein
MRGTGSNTLVATDVFVPNHRIISVPRAIEGDYATPFKDEPLYRAAFIPLLSLILIGPQLGMARAGLETVLQQVPKRGIAYTVYTKQAEAPTTHLQLALAAGYGDGQSPCRNRSRNQSGALRPRVAWPGNEYHRSYLKETRTETVRADQIGSFLRPPELIQAWAQLFAGQLAPERLEEIEDQAENRRGVGICSHGATGPQPTMRFCFGFSGQSHH